MGQGRVGDEERRLGGPAQVLLGEPQLFFAQRRAVNPGGVLLVRAAVADVGAGDDQRGTGIGLGSADGSGDALQVVPVYVLHVPAVGLEAPASILGEGQVGAALDGDAVVVVQVDQLAQAQMAGQRRSLRCHPLHQVSVADDSVDVVINDLVARTIEVGGQVGLGDGHAHAVGETLPQRAGGGLHPRCRAVLRMAGSAATPLSETLQLLQREIVAGEVQQAVQQHGAMPSRQDKPIPVWPGKIGRVMSQEARPQHIGHSRRAHRQARVARIGLLHPIHGQGAKGVDAKLIQFSLLSHPPLP